MPSYTFRNKTTLLESVHTMKIAELFSFKLENPELEQILTPTPLADPTRVGVTTKPAESFRDLLRTVKQKNHGSNINTEGL